MRTLNRAVSCLLVQYFELVCVPCMCMYWSLGAGSWWEVLHSLLTTLQATCTDYRITEVERLSELDSKVELVQ